MPPRANGLRQNADCVFELADLSFQLGVAFAMSSTCCACSTSIRVATPFPSRVRQPDGILLRGDGLSGRELEIEREQRKCRSPRHSLTSESRSSARACLAVGHARGFVARLNPRTGQLKCRVGCKVLFFDRVGNPPWKNSRSCRRHWRSPAGTGRCASL